MKGSDAIVHAATVATGGALKVSRGVEADPELDPFGVWGALAESWMEDIEKAGQAMRLLRDAVKAERSGLTIESLRVNGFRAVLQAAITGLMLLATIPGIKDLPDPKPPTPSGGPRRDN